MEKPLNVGFLGYGTRGLDALMEHPDFEVKYFFAPKSRICREVCEARDRYWGKLEYAVVEDNRDLAARFAQIHNVDCFVMNACPIILSQEVLDLMDVFNIHPGNLENNRGHHPHLWTVLLGEKTSRITLHQVNCQIDDGVVVKSVEVDIAPDDNAGDVLNKLEDHIPELLSALYAYRTGRGTAPEAVIHGGGYRRVMTYGDYEIHPETDDFGCALRKVLARSMHHGAFVEKDGRRYYVDRVIGRAPSAKEGPAVAVDRREGTVALRLGGEDVLFHLGKIEESGR
ncbi:MAG: hypothetical protein KH230_21045 [Enterocloster asparagiformis]|nr:hypothetical protein [Enterocloster asparagiformis]